jgi:hypothetical protein
MASMVNQANQSHERDVYKNDAGCKAKLFLEARLPK